MTHVDARPLPHCPRDHEIVKVDVAAQRIGPGRTQGAYLTPPRMAGCVVARLQCGHWNSLLVYD
jgi:hypothetical protein